MSTKKLKITIAIITYMRPKSLERLLLSLINQNLSDPNRYRINIHIVDNDTTGDNKKIATKIRKVSPFTIKTVTEKQKGLCYARQRSLEATKKEDAVIFIDDDEIAPSYWLDTLLQNWQLLGVPILTGPVTGILPQPSPAWATSVLYSHERVGETGYRSHHAYTNNVLVTREAIDSIPSPQEAFPLRFNESGCEDTYFFCKLAQNGFPTTLCKEARVFEIVPPSRVKIGWILKRAFRTGSGQMIVHRKLFGIRSSVTRLVGYIFLNTLRGTKEIILGTLYGQHGRVVHGGRLYFSMFGKFAGLFNLTYKEYETTHDESGDER